MNILVKKLEDFSTRCRKLYYESFLQLNSVNGEIFILGGEFSIKIKLTV